MGRIRAELIERTEALAHRMVDVADALESKRTSWRVIEQITGCGTSVGANSAEADEATSRREFAKIIGIVMRELAESKFWIRFLAKRGWISARRLAPLEQEAGELRRIFGSMTARMRKQERLTAN